MDEILIEERRYISSKRAAKVTGYAKDYIGQLCREGRVPARLIGRNWYVLETAIHDHRFGQQDHAPAGSVEETEPVAQAPQSALESPRYEASPAAEVLPLIHRTHDVDQPPANEQREASQYVQDSWREWFDRVADAASAIPDAISSENPVEEKEAEEIMADEKDEKEVQIPIRAIHHQQYQAPPEELLPRRHITKEEKKNVSESAREQQEQRKIGKNAIMAIRTTGVLFAIVSVIFAVIGSGYFDKYIISYSQASIFTGVYLYNK